MSLEENKAKQPNEPELEDIWVWEQNGELKEVEVADPEETPPQDFRIKEVNKTISELLEKKQQIVFVKANSGFGISKYFIPRLAEGLRARGLEMYHTEILDESYIKHSDELGDVLVIDELGQSTGKFEGGIAILTQILKKRPDIRVIVVFDDTKHPEVRSQLEKLQRDGSLGNVEMNPKLLNPAQATDFAMHGAPFRKTSSDGTLFDGLSQEQSRKIIEAFAKKFPLHFRLINILRWSGDSYDWEKEQEIPFEERLQLVEGDELDYKFEEQMSWDPMGLKAKT